MLNGKKEFWEIDNDKLVLGESVSDIIYFVWDLFVWFLGCLFVFSVVRKDR